MSLRYKTKEIINICQGVYYRSWVHALFIKRKINKAQIKLRQDLAKCQTKKSRKVDDHV